MTIEPELAQHAVSSWLQKSLAAKLGRCRRCMLLNGVLLLASWLLVYLLARLDPIVSALLVTATVVAVLFTLLAGTHAAAAALRSLTRSPYRAGASPTFASDPVAPVAAPRPRRGGCGCGSAASSPHHAA